MAEGEQGKVTSYSYNMGGEVVSTVRYRYTYGEEGDQNPGLQLVEVEGELKGCPVPYLNLGKRPAGPVPSGPGGPPGPSGPE